MSVRRRERGPVRRYDSTTIGTIAVGVVVAVGVLVAVFLVAAMRQKDGGESAGESGASSVPMSTAMRVRMSDLVGAYRKGDGDRYTGKVYACSVILGAAYEDGDGVPCILSDTMKLTRQPDAVARLQSRAGWEQSKMLNNEVWVEGIISGPKALSETSWGKKWSELTPNATAIPGSVVVIDNARIVTVR